MNSTAEGVNKKEESRLSLREIGYATIKELETENGILASGKNELYGCVFGRDSLITGLKLLKAYEKTKDPYLASLVKKILTNLIALQGRETNIESGEEPGKCIHEYRPTNHEHLTKSLAKPWYVYPDNAMRNYDSVDATPLLLLTIQEYHRATGDAEFMKAALPGAMAALGWVLSKSDANPDGFLDYELNPNRIHGGLITQSWMDSGESLFHEDGSPVAYPVAPVEVQAYVYDALRQWSDFFKDPDPELSHELAVRADKLKERFNQKFVSDREDGFSIAFAIDGNGKPLVSARSSMGHCLWAGSRNREGVLDTILESAFVPKLVARLMESDLFVPSAGVRTLSSRSSHFTPQSYHNGSIWPHDTGMIIGGFEQFGYTAEASALRQALLKAYEHFGTPLELFSFTDSEYQEYRSSGGQEACRKQAWSAAVMLAESC